MFWLWLFSSHFAKVVTRSIGRVDGNDDDGQTDRRTADRRSTFVAERSEIEIEIEILVQLPSFSSSSSTSLDAAALWSRMSVKRVFRYFSAFSALNMPTMAATPLSTSVNFGYLICAHIFAGIIIVTTTTPFPSRHRLRLSLHLRFQLQLRDSLRL